MYRVLISALFYVFSFGLCLGQCLVPSFSIPSSACTAGNIAIVNSSAAGEYEFDYCSGDLDNNPTAELAYSIGGAIGRPSMDFAKQGNKWIALLTGTYTSKLYRLEFGNGLGANPTVTEDLGSLGGLLDQPGTVKVVNQNGNWFALVHNTTGGNLILLSFGNSLTNTFTSSVLMNTMGGNNNGFALEYDTTQGWVCVMTIPGEKFQIINLGFDLASANPSSIVTPAISGSSLLMDVDLIKSCDQWYGYATNFSGGKIFRLSFGTSLYQQPTIDLLTDLGTQNTSRLKTMREGQDYFLGVAALDGPIYKVSLGNDLSSGFSSVKNEGDFGVLSRSFGIAVAKENSEWSMSVVAEGGSISRIKYPNVCSASVVSSDQISPVITYSQSGTYKISLTVTDQSGLKSTLSKSISVSSLVAPDIDFTSTNSCAGSAVTFNETNSSGTISSRSWSFGDGQSSSSVNPSHVYATSGIYEAKLTVTATNTCTNFTSKLIPIYNAPIADFSLPTSNPVCTNQVYNFTNLSVVDAGSNPSWEWRLNGNLVSTDINFSGAFSGAIPQEIKLKFSILGCSNEKTSTISTVVIGPAINFSAADNCQANNVTFTNTTSGADAGFSWNFGDGNISTLTNPTHAYVNPGEKIVTLTASNSAGCNNTKSQALRIYSKPTPDFSVGLPPFSCSNTNTPFQNNTPVLTDSNISNWSWQFGDAASGTSLQQNPSYVFTSGGNYNVTLTATSDKNCTNTITKNISIANSPIADFAVAPSCLNVGTKFTDLSSGSVQSRSWQIGSASFTTASPTYTFTAPGDYNAILTVTGSNLCSTFKTVNVHVPVPPTVNFTSTNLCSTKSARFTDATSSPQDAIVGWNWNFAGDTQTGNPVDNTFATANTYNVKLTTTHLSGCKYTLSRNVIVNPSPVAGFTASPDKGAAPLIVQFTNTSASASGYVWKFNDRTVATSTATSPTYTFTALGDYSAELTATNAFGCSDVKTLPIQVLVPAIDLALTDFTLTPDPTSGKLKGVVTVLNNSNVPVPSVEIGLILADKAVVNETFVVNLSPGQSAVRTLSFTISPNQFEFNFLCARINSERDIKQDNNSRCFNLDKTDYFLSPYPNPTKGILHTDWISVSGSPARIVIYDSMGKRCIEWQTPSSPGLNQSQFDITLLSSGLYFLYIETSGSKKTSRFFKE